ncbi:hypothetical protein GCM10011519_27950 [Marmoricola endophyticus]|uniref:Uncharacterized protein n=1 Tax=Marmoricola endophyticus TaxID=2040280 RepID=A0A917BMX8_9ACTN|nr:hypothetical protein GCM10011519_27950 [Marmoricola endophyticus]
MTTERMNPTLTETGWLQTRQVTEPGPKKPWSAAGVAIIWSSVGRSCVLLSVMIGPLDNWYVAYRTSYCDVASLASASVGFEP